MSLSCVDQVYKALRLLPEFDGNPNVLTRFVHLCDQLVDQFVRAEPGFELSNLALLNGILNKVTGHAARTINSNGIPENWQGIRNALINNFSDQRDETALYNDLALLTQKHLNPQEFYEKCQSLFSTIMTYVTLHESIQTTIDAKRTLYKKLTLQAFVRGLKEPLGSRIRCMRPDTIEKALEFVHEEINTLYLQQRNDHLPERRVQSTSSFDPTVNTVRPFNLPPSRSFNFSHPLNNTRDPSKFTFQPPRPMQIWRPQMPFNRGPTRTQQMFNAPPPNYRPQSNVFRIPQQKPSHTPPNLGPKPMSGVSHFIPKSAHRPMTGHDWTKQGNPSPSNYFKSHEMNINEIDNFYDYYEYPDYNYDYYDYYEQTHLEPTYETVYEQPYSDYVSDNVEEHQEGTSPSESQDFQISSEVRQAKIEINLQTQRQLPFIQIVNPPLKLLIDTGANKSFISPDAVERFYSNIPCNYEPFEVTNIHATTRNNYSITVPCFPELKENCDITLFIYKFHNYFDGLIGLDLLEKLESSIDLKNKVLVTRKSTNPLQMYDSQNCNLYEDIIPANTAKLICVPINFHDGDALVKEQKLSNCIIRDCVTTVQNSRGIIEITNPTQHDVVFSMDRPVSADLFNLQCTRTQQPSDRVSEVLSRLRTNHLNPEERANLESLCAQYADVFYLDGEPLTFTNKIKHSINTTDELPVYTKTYRYPFVHRQEVQEQISKMLDQRIIRPSQSAWSSPIWVVPKKTDASGQRKWRIVVDFRKINEKTIDDKYPIPNINDVLDKLGNCHYFTTLDLASGFYQVEMDPADIHKTAFNVEHGHFEFLRMPMGLKNSPSTFQRVMDNVLRDLQNVICLVYLDDIIVFSTSLQEHIVNLAKVFKRLRESNFKIQMDKSEFLKLETSYLGHIISKDGIKPNPDKIAAIQRFPIPKTATEIKRFLGLLGYYRKFIPDFARITKPMTQCQKKGSKISHDDPKYIECFEKCKVLLINDPILQYPDFTKDFVLTTDASNFAIGAVLSQGPIGSDKPIAYASRTLNSSEISYSTIEKELLSIVWATKYFRPYLFGRKFKIMTDHRPLQWVMSLKEPGSRLTRWRLKLSEYNFSVVYKQGKQNTNADALSRIELNNEDTSSIVVNVSRRTHSITDSETLTVPTDNGETLENQANSDTATIHTDNESPILEVPISDDPLNKFYRQICFVLVGDIKKRPTVTKPFETHTRTTIQLSESNLTTDVVNAVKEYVNPKVRTGIIIHPPLAMYKIIPIIQDSFKNSSMNLVLTKVELENVKEYLRQQEIIKKYHEGKTNHRGITECYLALSSKYYWPKMKDCIAKYINECSICGQAKYDRNPIKQRFSIVPPPSKPFQIVHLDLFTVHSEKFVTFVDAFSKYAQAYQLRDSTALSIVQALLVFCTHHGAPLTIVTDGGPEFTNQIFAEFTRIHKIQHHKILAYSPNDNGIVERFHSTILEHLRILKLERRNELIVNLMPYAILAYNSSIHSFTKCRPLDLITGHFDPRDPVDIDLSEHLFQQYSQDHRKRMTQVYDLINETSLNDRTQLTENRNKNREPEKHYAPEQHVFIRNPMASRQKLAPRYTHDTVLADLPIHIYTKKKRGPVAKSRLKRSSKNSNAKTHYK